MRRSFAPVLPFAFVLLACGGGGDPSADAQGELACIPNQQIECEFPGGGYGTRVCDEQGKAFGACESCIGTGSASCKAPSCGGCKTCFDQCVCSGTAAKTCVKTCNGAGGSSGAGGGPSSGSGGSGGGSAAGGGSGGDGGWGGGSGGDGGWGGGGAGPLDCQGCVSQACSGELSSCTSAGSCLELVACAQQSGCALDAYGCLIVACGPYLLDFSALPAALALGSCAASACGAECS
jgi:hypothetical protein